MPERPEGEADENAGGIADAVIRPEPWTDVLRPGAVFGRRAPLEVDIGCGKGRFLLARARKHPETDFLGIDRMLRRIRKVNRKVVRGGLVNVRLIRAEAAYVVRYLLPPGSVSVFYLFFPDPWPKRRHHKRRLFTPEFTDALAATLEPGGRVHITTDHAQYFAGIRERLSVDARFEPIPGFVPDEDERTDFELIFLNRRDPVGRCSFRKRPPSA